MRVGDDVLYVPDECHALIPDARGQFPWVVGRKGRSGGIEEISDAELMNLLKVLKRQKGSLAKEGLELIRPKMTWPAVVKSISADDKLVDLDVNVPNSAVTLHVTVPVDPEGKKTHSCHESPPETVAAPEPMSPLRASPKVAKGQGKPVEDDE